MYIYFDNVHQYEIVAIFLFAIEHPSERDVAPPAGAAILQPI